jgi:hypothetical protein
MALNIRGATDMADEYPRVLYHENGQTRTVRNAEEEKAAGPGWTSNMNENITMAMRKAAGSIAEVIEPVSVQPLQRRTN